MASDNPLHPIPSPPRKFMIGNMLAVRASAPIQDMMQLSRDLGPIFWLDMMGKPLVVVSGFDLVDELCNEERFAKSTRGALRKLRPIAHGLFTADTEEPRWSKSHNILLPTFAQRAMQGYHDAMLDIAGQLMLKWERLNADDEIDVTDDMTRLTLDTIGLCGFDYRFNSFYRDGNHPFVDAMVRSLEATMHSRGLPLEDLINRLSSVSCATTPATCTTWSRTSSGRGAIAARIRARRICSLSCSPASTGRPGSGSTTPRSATRPSSS
jgi:cytochrome P450/NADPH-cytochrome P450 reductase